MRLTYTALATLAALLSCSDSVPTAGNPKAVLKHDVSLVARGTGGDDNGADGKRLLRNAYAQDESQDSQLFEERSVAVPETATVGVASGVAHVIASDANPIAKKVVEANTHVKDGAGQEKNWLLTKLESFKDWAKELSFIKGIMKWWKRWIHNPNHVDKNAKPVSSTPSVEGEKITEKEAEVKKSATADKPVPPPAYTPPLSEGNVKTAGETSKVPTDNGKLPVGTVTKTEGKSTVSSQNEKPIMTAGTHGTDSTKPQGAGNPSKNTEGGVPLKIDAPVSTQGHKDG